MSVKKTFKLIVLLFFVILLLIISIIGLNRKSDVLNSLAIMSNEEIAYYSKYVFKDYSENIFYNGQKAAIDKNTSTIYVYVDRDELNNNNNNTILNGLLEILTKKEVVFGVSGDDCLNAVRENQPLKLIIAEKNSNEYMQYNLILTSLPVINLTGGNIGKSKNGRELNGGEFTIWDYSNCTSPQSSDVHWYIRGRSSALFDKKSFKLSFKKRNDDNDMTFLDLGYDDEWILNGMGIDDTKLREKLLMDIWNQMQNISTYNLKMSSGEYVELIVNGKYAGLYLLQRQINEKYLELDSDTVLLRGNDEYVSGGLYEAYGIEYSGRITDKEALDRMNGFFSMNDFSSLNKDNWVDLNLFIQFGNLVDNTWLRNSYYVLDEKQKEELRILLWDVDLSFGVRWAKGRFTYNYDPNLKAIRKEYSASLLASPHITGMMSERWRQLRSDFLSDDNLFKIVNDYNLYVNDSGAMLRDKDVNGLFHNGEDTYENLIAYIHEQLRLMDELYLEKE